MNVNKTIFIIMYIYFKVNALEECEWHNKNGVPCLTISKTPNTSKYTNENIVKKISITKARYHFSGALDTFDILKLISGLDVIISLVKKDKWSNFYERFRIKSYFSSY